MSDEELEGMEAQGMGVSSQASGDTGGTGKTDVEEEVTCETCYVDYPLSETLAPACGHRFDHFSISTSPRMFEVCILSNCSPSGCWLIPREQVLLVVLAAVC